MHWPAQKRFSAESQYAPRRRRIARAVSVLLILLLMVSFPDAGVPQARAEEPHANVASPWEHELWRRASPPMRHYICGYAERPPSWCPASSPVTAVPQAAVEEAGKDYGPFMTADDRRWRALLKTGNPERLSAADIALVKRRAEEQGNPRAMEILGFLYFNGFGVPVDYPASYLWYGRAFLAGERQVKANLDAVWKKLNDRDPAAAMAMVKLFDAVPSDPTATQ